MPYHLDLRVECSGGDAALTGQDIAGLIGKLQSGALVKSILEHEAILPLNANFTGLLRGDAVFPRLMPKENHLFQQTV